MYYICIILFLIILSTRRERTRKRKICDWIILHQYWINVLPSGRVFARSRHRKTANSSSGGSGGNEGSDGFDPYRSWSPLTEEGYAEKLRLLREAASVPMERWRAPTVLAWLEVALGMPQYGPRCAENVKSGKVKDLSPVSINEL